jgi:hypothetical protein
MTELARLLGSVVTSAWGKTSHLMYRIDLMAGMAGMAASFFLVFRTRLTVISIKS